MARAFVLEWLHAVALAPLPTAAKAVALACSTFADYGTGQNMRASAEVLAGMSGIQQRQARRMLDILTDTGLMVMADARTWPGHPRNYTLTLPAITGHPRPVNNEDHRSPMTGDGDGTPVTHDRITGHPRPEHRSPVTTYQYQTSTKPERASALAAPIVTAGPPPIGCVKHPNGTTEPCGPCGQARAAHKAWQLADEVERSRRNMPRPVEEVLAIRDYCDCGAAPGQPHAYPCHRAAPRRSLATARAS